MALQIKVRAWWWETDGNASANGSIGASVGDVGREGGVGSGSKAMLNGRALGSDGRMGSTVNLEVRRR